MRDNGRFHLVYLCQDQQLPSHRERFGLETLQSALKQRWQLQKETAGIELTLPRHMWIMDHFHSSSHAFAQVRGYRAGVEESADVKLSM